MTKSITRLPDGRALAVHAFVGDLLQTKTVQAALRIGDPERVSSAPGIALALHRHIEATNTDNHLSAEGKRAKVAPLAESAFGNLASLAREWRELRGKHEADVLGAVKIPEPTASDTLIDLALAERHRADPPTLTKLTMSSERLRYALLRVPGELSGLDDVSRDRIRGSLVSADRALEFEHGRLAIDHAKDAIQRAISFTAAHLPTADYVARRAEIGGEPFHL